MKLAIIKEGIPYLVLLMIGFYFRIYKFDTYPFGFDQVQILENARAIVGGDLRLIGPMTGPAQMYTGPLIYYIAAFWLLLLKNPYALTVTTLFIFLITGLVLYILLKRHLSNKYRLLYFALWSLSPYMVSLDRVTWNPNLTLLSAFLVFIPLIKIVSEKKFEIIDALFCFFGVFLGYQAHFSGLILPILLVITWILFIRKKIILLAVSLFGLIITITPTIWFDLRHAFLNTHGLWDFIVNNHKIGIEPYYIFMWKNILITIENIGKTLFLNNSNPLIMICGLTVVWGFMTICQNKSIKKYVSIWLITTVILLGIYRHDSPEYYFIIQIPPILLIITTLLVKVLTNIKASLLALTIFTIYSFLTIQKIIVGSGHLDMGSQIKAEMYLKNNNELKTSRFIFDMKPSNQVGLNYLLRNYKFENNGNVVHIVYPYQQNNLKDIQFGPLAIWIDPRIEGSSYLELSNMILFLPNRLSIPNHFDEGMFETNSLFGVFIDGIEKGQMIIVDRRNEEKVYDRYDSLLQNCDINHNCQNTNKHWIGVIEKNGIVQIRREKDTLLVFYRGNNVTDDGLQMVYKAFVLKK